MALASIGSLRRAAPALLVVAGLLLGACTSGRNGPGTSPTPKPVAQVTKYQAAVDAAAARDLQVWLEGDLAKRWLEGRARFDEGVARLADLAARPGVLGIKIADELAYDDGFGNDPARVRAFLADSAAALGKAAPGKKLLVDILVPELGCAPGASGAKAKLAGAVCRAKARSKYPALTVEQVDGYLASGHLDVVNLSTGLLSESTYRDWGIDRDKAQRLAWAEAKRRGWPSRVRLQYRKALAFPGRYPGGPATAESDLRTFVDLPRSEGAPAVDIWTWRQKYKGEIVRLMDPGNQDNSLWQGLRKRKAGGAALFTHFTPSSTEQGMDTDLDELAEVFAGVYTAAGIG
ncbi:MAG TPA: hypothetical protein VG276_04390 [Actinomycetes bacterium]|jgi:hypothetical protein|nr:hypothetical protein [Actinomycetes bacterium]